MTKQIQVEKQTTLQKKQCIKMTLHVRIHVSIQIYTVLCCMTFSWKDIEKCLHTPNEVPVTEERNDSISILIGESRNLIMANYMEDGYTYTNHDQESPTRTWMKGYLEENGEELFIGI